MEKKRQWGEEWGGGVGDALEHCPLNWVLAHIISPKPALTQRQTTNELWAAEDAACKRGEEGVRGGWGGGSSALHKECTGEE